MNDKKFGVDINLLMSTLKNTRFENLSVDPVLGTAQEGYVYFNTLTNTLRIWDGVNWLMLSSNVIANITTLGIVKGGGNIDIGLDGTLSVNLSDYATEDWVESRGFLTSANLVGYATVLSLTSGLALKSNVGHMHTHYDIVDFDTAVANHPNVILNSLNRHSHNNKIVLDGISSSRVIAWDNTVRYDVSQALTPTQKQQGRDNLGITSYSGDLTYTHDQGAPSSMWIISHNLNKYPSVSVVDTASNIVVGAIHYSDLNNITIKFNSAFSGKAHFN